MVIRRHPLRFFIVFTCACLASLLFAIVPLSPALSPLRPELVCLVVFFFLLYCPQYLSLALVFFVGLLQDLVELGIWGAHAFALVMSAYIILSAEHRLRSYGVWRQTLWISVLIGLHQVLVNWVQGLAGYAVAPHVLLCSVLSTSIFWPFMYLLAPKLLRLLRLA
ncbi:rod shape-determining protein MreD [Agaribacterium sp. ZY112]|uniref:rod shape-determining protein MreD n=1 Tax=Agaribacterium sp. ZY112 TaxID=3233574 RepID=UPI0035237CB8